MWGGVDNPFALVKVVRYADWLAQLAVVDLELVWIGGESGPEASR